jgi:hypothetical protein
MSSSSIIAKKAGFTFKCIVLLMSTVGKYWFFKLWFIPTCKLKLLMGYFPNSIYKLKPGVLPPMNVLTIEVAATLAVVIFALKILSHRELEQLDCASLNEVGK